MTALTGQNPNTTYVALLQCGDAVGLTSSLKTMQDGLGTSSALKLSTTQVNCGNVTMTGTTLSVVSGSLTITPNTTISGNLTVIGTSTLSGGITLANPSTFGTAVFTLGGNLTTSGASALTLTTTGATNVTLPTSGTVLSTAAVVTGTQGGTGVNNSTKTLTYLKNISLTAADDTGVYTLPTGTMTLVGRSSTDTLTNKTLTSPTISSPTISGAIAMTGVDNWAQGSNIASATTTDIGAATGNSINVTGTTTITGFGTVQAGTIRVVTFTGILTLTYNATSLKLPTAANITTAVGDIAVMQSLGSGNWNCVSYQRASGASLVGGNVTASSIAANGGAGIPVQVVQGTLSTTLGMNTQSYTDTGLSISITPTASTSTVLVRAVVNCSTSSNDVIGLQLVRNSTAIGVGTAAGSRTTVGASTFIQGNNSMSTLTLEYLDSPATTSATTYKVQYISLYGVNVYINRTIDDTNSSSYTRGLSTITCMEVK